VALKVKKVKDRYQFILKEEIMKGKQMDSYKINLHCCGRTKIARSPDGTKIAYTSLYETRKDISWVSADGSASGTIVTNGWNADWQH
jgi:hypothetical protein